MKLAADYADEWFATDRVGFRFYCACRANVGNQTCSALILPNASLRLREEKEAAGQRWYCECGTRRATKFGVLVDGRRWCCNVLQGFSSALRRAGCQVRDHRCYQQGQTPQELLAAWPDVRPLGANVFFKPQAKFGYYKYDVGVREYLCALEWNQLCNLVGGFEKNKKNQCEACGDSSCLQFRLCQAGCHSIRSRILVVGSFTCVTLAVDCTHSSFLQFRLRQAACRSIRSHAFLLLAVSPVSGWLSFN
jgi:hypothetical protein